MVQFTGKTISHYRILELVGQGGMGVVYKAEDTILNRTVALKFLKQEEFRSEEDKERFLREAQAAAALDHPNICIVHEINQHGVQHFIVMPYLEGQTLEDVLKSGHVPIDNAIQIAIQIAEGLQAAHEQGIIHRDIKSANIMISLKGQVKIMDFGLARLSEKESKITKPGSTPGTVAYMSPEQARGEEVDERTDIWSLGVVLYELFSGHILFPGDSVYKMLSNIVNNEPEPIETYRDDISSKHRKILNNLLSKNPNNRYASCKDILIDLNKLRRIIPSKKEHKKKITYFKKPTIIPLVIYFVFVCFFIALYFFQIRKSDQQLRSSLVKLAVFDFQYLGNVQDNSYLSLGLTEDITRRLSSIDHLLILPQNDIYRFKNIIANHYELGEKLGVDYILSGSLNRKNDNLTITGKVVHISSRQTKWTNSFDGKIDDIFLLRENFLKEVLQALNISVSPISEQKIYEKPALNVRAYDYYLRGQDYFKRHFRKNYDIAQTMYKNALEIDSNYSLAYIGLGRTYLKKYLWYLQRDRALVDSARYFIEKAEKIDPSSEEVHIAIGDLYRQQGPEMLENAIQEYKKAIQLKNTHLDAMRSLARILWLSEQFEESKKWSEQILKIHSIDPDAYIEIGFANWLQGFIQHASECFDKAIELQPDLPYVYGQKAYFCFLNGMFDEAKYFYEKNLELDPSSTQALAVLAQLYFIQKDTIKAIEYYKKTAKKGGDGIDYFRIGLMYNFIKNNKLANVYYDSSKSVSLKFLERSPDDHRWLTDLAIIQAVRGNEPEALKLIKQAKSTNDFKTNILRRNRVLMREAIVYSQLGKIDQGIEAIKIILKDRVYSLETIKHFIGLENLRSDPKFEKIILNL